LFETEPSEGTAGRRIVWPQGFVVGGSSSTSDMIFIRGQHEDFDDWERLGALGWNYRSVLPFFKSMKVMKEGRVSFTADRENLKFPISEQATLRAACGSMLRANWGFHIT
jgi:choline dehydrogenase-like flavoprotein